MRGETWDDVGLPLSASERDRLESFRIESATRRAAGLTCMIGSEWMTRDEFDSRGVGSTLCDILENEGGRVWIPERDDPMRPTRLDLIQKLFNDQDGRCFYCARGLVGGFHKEHMIPRSRGGSDHLSNIVLSCPYCNLSKGTRTATEFILETVVSRRELMLRRRAIRLRGRADRQCDAHGNGTCAVCTRSARQKAEALRQLAIRAKLEKCWCWGAPPCPACRALGRLSHPDSTLHVADELRPRGDSVR